MPEQELSEVAAAGRGAEQRVGEEVGAGVQRVGEAAGSGVQRVGEAAGSGVQLVGEAAVAGDGQQELSGVGVSAGTAIGPVVRMTAPAPLPPPHRVTDSAGEQSSARAAVAAVAADLSERADRLSGEAREILEALAMIAQDPLLAEDIDQRVAAGSDAAHALTEAFDAQADLLREGGGYLAERAADLEDLRDRAVATVLGRPIPGIPDPGHPFVLVAADLAPADTANLNPDQVLAIATERGGPTSHTAILARGLGIPAIVAVAGVTEIADGTVVAVDGTAGTVTVGVEAVASDPVPRVRTQADLADLGPCRTKDGHPVSLYLNIGSIKDVRAGAQGVGLLRTEFLFLGRKDAPSVAEQHAAYLELFEAFPDPAPASSSARWTPAPTNPCRSSACPMRRTRRSASGVCGPRACVRRSSTTSSPPSPLRPPKRPARSGPWPPWSPPRPRPRSSRPGRGPTAWNTSAP